MKIRPMGVELFRAGGQIDTLTGMTRQIVAFRSFAYAPKNQPVNAVYENNYSSETNTKHRVGRT